MKLPFAVVLEQPVLPDRGDQNIREAIVVVIADGHAHAVHLHRQVRRARVTSVNVPLRLFR